MRLFTRYLTFELAKIFLATLTGLTLFMLVVGVVQEAHDQGLSFMTILKILPYLLPNALRFAVPGTILFAACNIYGRMSSFNEILAVKSLGISPLAVLWPAYILAFVTSLLAVWFNDLAVSWGTYGVKRVLIESAEEIIYSVLRTNGQYSSDKISINVSRVEGQMMIEPMILIHPHDNSPPVTVLAKSAELRSDHEAGEFVIYLTDSNIEYGDNVVFSHPGTLPHVIPLFENSETDLSVARTSQIALRNIQSAITTQRKIIKNFRQSLAADAAYGMLTGELSDLATQAWQDRFDTIGHHIHRLHRLRTEPYRRWANGFSCLFFVFVGAPLAIRMRNSDLMTTFGVCFLPILVLYYPLLALAVGRAKCGALPPYSVWLGNIILCVIGLALMQRVLRH